MNPINLNHCLCAQQHSLLASLEILYARKVYAIYIYMYLLQKADNKGTDQAALVSPHYLNMSVQYTMILTAVK